MGRIPICGSFFASGVRLRSVELSRLFGLVSVEDVAMMGYDLMFVREEIADLKAQLAST